ncbi:MAG: TetR/AcrR family transcriptional regulator [Candidatus Marinimicrobia bacterium]|nr:TetR/AcrR family transcriptional regulator [Candidatus Neomarinimicrobiota bacterium]
MNEKKLKTPEKIVNSTIECIEHYGFDALTVRMIAETAKVNIAAINYHFRSKENLIQQVIQTTLNHMIEDIEEIIYIPDKTPRDIIRNIIEYLLEGALRYPELTKLNFYDTFIHNNFDTLANKKINKILLMLNKQIEKQVKLSVDEISITLTRIFSTLFFEILFPGYFTASLGYDLQHTPQVREVFLENIINTLPF